MERLLSTEQHLSIDFMLVMWRYMHIMHAKKCFAAWLDLNDFPFDKNEILISFLSNGKSFRSNHAAKNFFACIICMYLHITSMKSILRCCSVLKSLSKPTYGKFSSSADFAHESNHWIWSSHLV